MTNRGYKRSWKNLLINKRYQLRFTLFMVFLAVILMAGLGWWVVRVADEATSVAQSRWRGKTCVEWPELVPTEVVVDTGEMTFDEPGADTGLGSGSGSGTGTGTGSGTGSGAGSETTAGGHAIVMDEPSMTIKRVQVHMVAPTDFDAQFAEHVTCELEKTGQIRDLDHGRQRIVGVLVIACVAVLVGLVLFGIKMTHRVAGPLYKVTLYLAKLRDGRYDKVYDLRKGDQLREFYEHFKEAHAGVVAMEQGDRDRIAAALDAAIADGLLERSPEVRTAAEELRAVLERKEKALGKS